MWKNDIFDWIWKIFEILLHPPHGKFWTVSGCMRKKSLQFQNFQKTPLPNGARDPPQDLILLSFSHFSIISENFFQFICYIGKKLMRIENASTSSIIISHFKYKFEEFFLIPVEVIAIVTSNLEQFFFNPNLWRTSTVIKFSGKLDLLPEINHR